MTNQEVVESLALLEEFFHHRSLDPKDLGGENRDGLWAISGLMKSALIHFHDITGLNISGDVTGIQLVRAARVE